ncbi:hypothetical protein PHJA_003014300 [Phtheirospermum japonicum]|uniref:Uncharacterized protein n=1 Tax=Phtheirospermum japonicum TaxID=374723 RepID=A0A830DDE5_9LAMI|nr:hypothetical protein PHJA_003014300 [Phtheirospermum japonicum]
MARAGSGTLVQNSGPMITRRKQRVKISPTGKKGHRQIGSHQLWRILLWLRKGVWRR